MTQIEAGQTITYRKGRSGRRHGFYIISVEQVSTITTYVYGIRVRISDGAHLGNGSVLLHSNTEIEIVADRAAG